MVIKELGELTMQVMQLYNLAKDNGYLSIIGNDLLAVNSALTRQITELDVEAFKAYTEAGMAPRDAVELLIARKARTKVAVNDLFGSKK
jgi:hypothetical protein